MGVIQLWPILAPVKEHKPLTSLSGQTLAVDLSIWVCESNAVKQMQGAVVKPHLRNLFFRVSNLTQMGIKLVFAVDGEAPELKQDTMAKRQQVRFPGKQKGTQAMSHKVKSAKKGRSRFNTILKECCELLDHLGIPYIYSRGEAEALCALLNRHGFADGCLTDDGDAFLYGAKDPHVESYSSKDIETNLKLTQEGLVALALLLGCDYLPKGVPGVGKEQAIKLVDQLQGSNMLDRFKFWQTCDLSELEGIQKSICKKALNVQEFPNEEVINEFLIPKDTCPEKELRIKRPWMEKLQDFLYTKLEWPMDYTEEKVLPLLTLWDMSDIIRTGRHHPSIHLVPHQIVKRRVRQGVPCYEVEWMRQDNCYTEEDKPNYRTIEEQDIFTQCFPSCVESFQTAEMTKKSSKPVKKKKMNADSKLEHDVDGVAEKLGTMGLDIEETCEHFTQASQLVEAGASGSSSTLEIYHSELSNNHQEKVEDQQSHRHVDVRAKKKSSARRKVQESCKSVKKREKQKTKQKSHSEDSDKGMVGSLDVNEAASTDHNDFVRAGNYRSLIPEIISDESEEEVSYVPLSQRIGLLSLRAMSKEGSEKVSDKTGQAVNDDRIEKTAVMSRQNEQSEKQCNLNSGIVRHHCLGISKPLDEILNGNPDHAEDLLIQKGDNSNIITLKGGNTNEITLKGDNSCESASEEEQCVESPPERANCELGHSVSVENYHVHQTNDKSLEINNNQRLDSKLNLNDIAIQCTPKAYPKESTTLESSSFISDIAACQPESQGLDSAVVNNTARRNKVDDKLKLFAVMDNVFDTPCEQKAKSSHSTSLINQLADIVENLSLNNDSVDLFSTPNDENKPLDLSPHGHRDVCTPEVVTRCVKQASSNIDGNFLEQKSGILSNVLTYSPPEVLKLMTKTMRDPEDLTQNSTPSGIVPRMEKYTPQTGKPRVLGISWADTSTISHGSPAYGFFNIESSLLNCSGDPCKLVCKDPQTANLKSKVEIHKANSLTEVLDFTPYKRNLHLNTSTPDVVKPHTDRLCVDGNNLLQTSINHYSEQLTYPASSESNNIHVSVPVHIQTLGDQPHSSMKNHADAAESEMMVTECNTPHLSHVIIQLESVKPHDSSINSMQKLVDETQVNTEDIKFALESRESISRSTGISVKCTKASQKLKEIEKLCVTTNLGTCNSNFGQEYHRSKTSNYHVNRDSRKNKTIKTSFTDLQQYPDKENNPVDYSKQSVSKSNQKSSIKVSEIEHTSSPMALADRLRAKMSLARSQTIYHETVLSVKKIGGLSVKFKPRQSTDLCTNVKPVKKK